MTGQSTLFNDLRYFYDVNPFKAGGYIGQCTWYCWSKAHSKAAAYPERNLLVTKIPTANAGQWFSIAKASGYEVSSIPKPDSIAVWSTGHVAYVETYHDAIVCFSEANWNPTKNTSNAIQVPDTVYASVKEYVHAFDTIVTVKSGGTDGVFKNLAKKDFESRKSGFLGYIYLN